MILYFYSQIRIKVVLKSILRASNTFIRIVKMASPIFIILVLVPSAHCRQLAARMQMATHPSPTKSMTTSGRWSDTPNVKASSITFLNLRDSYYN